MAGLGLAKKRDRRNINDYADVKVEPSDESREAALAQHYERRNSDYKHGPSSAARRAREEMEYRRWRNRNPRPPQPGTPDHYPEYDDEWQWRRRMSNR